jgi:hypothetical protein
MATEPVARSAGGVAADGTRADLNIDVVAANVTLTGTRGAIRVESASGGVEATDTEGNLDIDTDIVEIFDLISDAYEESAVYGTVPVRRALARAAAEARKIVDAR